jgi:proteasome lid subunit RPN8/RPN11
MSANQKLLLPRTKPWPGEDGPPIRRDPYDDEEPIRDDDPLPREGTPIFSRIPVMQLSHTAYDQMLDYLTDHPPERAVALIGPKDHDAVTHVLIDESGDSTPASFTLGHVLLNEKLKTFVAAGLDVKGIAHSHPLACCWPSQGDLRYVAKCFENDKQGLLDRFLLPIVCGQRLYPYLVFSDQPRAAQLAQVVLF